MQYQFIRKKKMVHPAVPNNATLVDACVTVYPIHIDQALQIFGERPSAIAQQFEGRTSCVL